MQRRNESSILDDDDPPYPTPTNPRRDFVINFFLNETIDAQGRTHDDILGYNANELEYHHDYIQLLFPLPEPSPFNPDAPLITSEVRKAFLEERELRKALVRGLDKMLEFYGFGIDFDMCAKDKLADLDQEGGFNAEWQGIKDENEDEAKEPTSSETGETDIDDPRKMLIRSGANFGRRAPKSWLRRMDHNHLRITRILRSLRVLGCETLAYCFYNALVAADEGGKVGANTWKYWRRAVERPLWLPPSENNENALGVGWLRRELQGQAKAEKEEDAEKDAEVKREGSPGWGFDGAD